MIEKLRLTNYKGFKSLNISLSKLNLIIGKNNSGKSTIIDALFDFSNLFRNYGESESYFTLGDDSLLNKTNDNYTNYLSIGFDFKNKRLFDGLIHIDYVFKKNEFDAKLYPNYRIITYGFDPRITIIEFFDSEKKLPIPSEISYTHNNFDAYKISQTQDFMIFVNKIEIIDFNLLYRSSSQSGLAKLKYGFKKNEQSLSDTEYQKFIEKNHLEKYNTPIEYINKILIGLNNIEDLFFEFNQYFSKILVFKPTRGPRVKYIDQIGIIPKHPSDDLGESLGNLLLYNADKYQRLAKPLNKFKVDNLVSKLSEIQSENANQSKIAIVYRDEDAGVLPITNLGSGSRQVSELISWLELIDDYNLVLVEEPEIHLDPINQASIMNYLVEKSKVAQLIITTHSEHILTRLQILIALNKEINVSDLSILYLSKNDQGFKVENIYLNKDGTFPNGLDHFLSHSQREQSRLLDAWAGKEIEF
ncbi:MAG: hypothetical protein HeimC2_00310 [Candidatus Heimdallarchaeota archaeon LC_2]|nr:MAG: hypothetical protein HeimC2_00310 [Candidatus Heimdallarchaeota archaeon LC_2]